MNALILLSLVGIAACQLYAPSPALLRPMVDAGFVRLDHNPQDNQVSQAEWDAIVSYDDTDNDGCVTEAEFQNVNHIEYPQLAVGIFNSFDHDKDGCMKVTDMNEEYKSMDTSGDGMVSRTEFDNHFVDLITKAFSSLSPFTG